MTTITGPASEWTAAALRPTATWVRLGGLDGRTRLEMVWAVPTIDSRDASAAADATPVG